MENEELNDETNRNEPNPDCENLFQKKIVELKHLISKTLINQEIGWNKKHRSTPGPGLATSAIVSVVFSLST